MIWEALAVVLGLQTSTQRCTSLHESEETAMNKVPKLLTIQDVADTVQVQHRTVRSWISKKKLRVIRFSHRLVRIRPADLEAFLAAHTEGVPTRPPRRQAKLTTAGKKR